MPNFFLQKRLSPLLVSLLLATTGSIANARPRLTLPISAGTAVTTPARLLQFPDDQSYGGIVITDRFSYSLAEIDTKAANHKARGKIQIAPGKIVAFFPNHNFYKNPHALDRLPANSIDYVYMRYISMDENDSNLGDAAVTYLCRFNSIRCFDLDKVEVSNKALSALNNCKKLERISLFAVDTDCAFLKDWKDLKMLRDFDISHTNAQGANLKYLAQLPGLVRFTANYVHLKDSDIASLASCKKLMDLSLANSPGITDRSLAVFLALPALQKLDLRKASLSEGSIKRLKARGITVWQTVPQHSLEYYRAKDGGGIFEPVSRGRGF
jgi:hypothetical protein